MTISKLAALALLCLGAVPTVAQAGASGTISIGGLSWTVADAAAALDAEESRLLITFTPSQFSRIDWPNDRKFDRSDLWRFVDERSGGAYLTLVLDAKTGAYLHYDYKDGDGSSGSDSGYDAGVRLATRSESRVAGTFQVDGPDKKARMDVRADVSFDLPVEKFAALVRPGTPLAADGGEPGKALGAYFEAFHSGDPERIVGQVAPKERAELQAELAKDPEATAQKLGLMKIFMPDRIERILGGSVDGDRAVIDFEGSSEGEALGGVATMTRLDGRWYVRHVNVNLSSN